MADRHTIVVRVNNGKVSEVLFCDCCPGLTLEVRTYTDSKMAAALALPAWHMEGGTSKRRSSSETSVEFTRRRTTSRGCRRRLAET